MRILALIVRSVAAALGIIGAVGTVWVGVITCSAGSLGATLPETHDPGRLADAFVIGRLLIVAAGVALALNLSLLKERLSRASCIVLGSAGCIASIFLAGIAVTVVSLAT